KAILFDLGETLFNYGKANINELLHQAARLTFDYLHQCTSEADKLGDFRHYYRQNVWSIKWRYILSNITNRDFNAQQLLKIQLRKKNIHVTPAQLEELCWLWYKPLGNLVTLEPDLPKHLQRLADMSLKLAIISNTFSPPAVLDRHLQQFDLLDFFPIRQYSSVSVYRKPHPRIYQSTLQSVGVQAHESVMVGDRLREDVVGAARLGIKPVLKRAYTNNGKRVDGPVTVIDNIAELPDIIARWQENS
ncbi:MAG: HAD family hydrolase, partial [Planctomycetes bacterium]|nr:HAD family hydrolase [Planctomycetota bacterium]